MRNHKVARLLVVVCATAFSPACEDLFAAEEKEGSTEQTPSGNTGQRGPNGTVVSACVDGLSTSQTASAAAWHALPAPFNGLDYKIYYSNTFQVYEIIFRNRFFDRIHFNFSPTGGAPTSGNGYRQSLATNAAGSPPGVTVRGAVTGGRGCVVIDRVRFGANDTGAYY